MQPESLEVDRPEPGVVLLRARGDLDAYTAPGLRAQLHEATSGEAELIVVGRSDVTGWSRFLYSSCALAVLERARTTVAVVPEHRTE